MIPQAGAWSNGKRRARNISIILLRAIPLRPPPKTCLSTDYAELDKENAMPEKMSRRKLLRKGSEAIVAGGVGACAAAVAGAVPATAAGPRPGAAEWVGDFQKRRLNSVLNTGRTTLNLVHLHNR